MSSRTYLSIGDVLTLLREEFPDVTISKIRFLESQGLVNPERSPSGYRKFFEADVERLRWVLRQQREHFLPLKVIRDRLDAGDLSEGGAGEPVAAAASAGAPINGKASARAHAVAGAGLSGRSRAGGLGGTTTAARTEGRSEGRGEGRTHEQSTQADDEAMARILADASRRVARVPESARQPAPLQAVPDPGAPHSAGHTDVLNVPREHDAAVAAATTAAAVTEGLRADPDAPHSEGSATIPGGAPIPGHTGDGGAQEQQASPRPSSTTTPAEAVPVATEPVATEPVATEPVATEPVATAPTAIAPAATARAAGESGAAAPRAAESAPQAAAASPAPTSAPHAAGGSGATGANGPTDGGGSVATAAGDAGGRGASSRGSGGQNAGAGAGSDAGGGAGGASARPEGGRQAGTDKRSSGSGGAGSAAAGQGGTAGTGGTGARSAGPAAERGGGAAGTRPASTSGMVTGASMTSEELCAASGLSEIELAGLQGFGLIEPTMVAGIPTFDEDALTVANLAAAFRKYGIEARHLRPYRNAVDREMGLIEQVIIPLLRQRNPESRQRAVEAADELGALGQTMRATLLRTALRRHVGG